MENPYQKAVIASVNFIWDLVDSIGKKDCPECGRAINGTTPCVCKESEVI
mgnify:CR=1 FL=1